MPHWCLVVRLFELNPPRGIACRVQGEPRVGPGHAHWVASPEWPHLQDQPPHPGWIHLLSRESPARWLDRGSSCYWLLQLVDVVKEEEMIPQQHDFPQRSMNWMQLKIHLYSLWLSACLWAMHDTIMEMTDACISLEATQDSTMKILEATLNWWYPQAGIDEWSKAGCNSSYHDDSQRIPQSNLREGLYSTCCVENNNMWHWKQCTTTGCCNVGQQHHHPTSICQPQQPRHYVTGDL